LLLARLTVATAVARAGTLVLGLSLAVAASRVVPTAAVATLLLAAAALAVAVLALVAVTTLTAGTVVAASAGIPGALVRVRGFRCGRAAEETHDALDHANGVGRRGGHHHRR